MTVNNTSDGSMLHVTAASPSSTSSSPQGFIYTNCEFGLTIPDVQDTYNLEKARCSVFHIAVLKKKGEQG